MHLDDCSSCTGGTTNKSFNYLLDCANTCGLAFKDNCGVCQIRSAYRNLSDCAGVCFGNATINKCGNCVEGTTNKSLTFGIIMLNYIYLNLKLINQYHATSLFLYPLKISENLWFSEVLRGYRKRVTI